MQGAVAAVLGIESEIAQSVGLLVPAGGARAPWRSKAAPQWKPPQSNRAGLLLAHHDRFDPARTTGGLNLDKPVVILAAVNHPVGLPQCGDE